MRRSAVIGTIVLTSAAGFLATAALAADRVAAVVDCKATADVLVYDCIIKLSNARTSVPLEQASLTVGADMPSMPMAHNVRPVIAKATGAPGEYQARLALEMYGDWAVRLRIAGPLKDQLVEMRNFDEKGAGPPRRKAGAPRGGGHKH
jgi:YtkA-like